MKTERTKNATRNLIFGLLYKAYTIIIPFVMRTVIIYYLGVEYLGLNSLVTSILQVLNLTELGVGGAMSFSLYKPIAEKDTITLCAIMKLYRLYYRFIGIVIAVIGLAITPFIPQLISGDVPAGINVYVLYLFNLAATVCTYWLFAYRNSLLPAHQRSDISNKVSFVTTTIQYVLQIIVIIVFKDLYLYTILALAMQIVSNVSMAAISAKMYPYYKPQGELPNEQVQLINQRIKDLFTAKFGATIVNSADTVVISAFLGLTVLAIYQNYYYIMTSVIGIITIIFSSCTAAIGNSLVLESSEKNYFDFKILAFYIMWIACEGVTCFACIYQPFMKVWVGDENMFGMGVVILLCIYFFVFVVNKLSESYKDAGGIWHEDRFRPFVSGLFNLILNLVLVKSLGIYAIILSTIISYLLIEMPWLIHNVFSNIFKRSPKEYIFIIIKGTLVCVITTVLCYLICSLVPFDGYLKIVINLLICLVVGDLILFVCYRSDSMFNPAMDMIDRILKWKFHHIIIRLKNHINN